MTASTSRRIAIDIGGTFTDCVVVDELAGTLDVIKVPSTPDDPSRGFLDALSRVTGGLGVDPAEVSLVMHATTVATNAILEGNLARTAFVVTRGFGDILEIGRQVRPQLYDLESMKPEPLVPRSLVFEVGERLDAEGQVVTPIDAADLAAAAQGIAAAGVQAVVVCFLHGYVDDRHERAATDYLRAALGEAT